jgi:uncharacterized protein YidB (DUF937 family)
MPSWTALLGVLAIAGYQNRDKISDWIEDARKSAVRDSGEPGTGNPDNGILSEIGSILNSDDPAGNLARAIGELVDRFKTSGDAETADSWVSSGRNQSVSPEQLEQAIGPYTLAELETKTGLSREQLLERLSRDLPEAVDHMTPLGRVPTAQEARQFI